MTSTSAPSTADDYVTAITQAPSQDAALAILRGAGKRTLAAIADLLYVDDYGLSAARIARAIVAEARAGECVTPGQGDSAFGPLS